MKLYFKILLLIFLVLLLVLVRMFEYKLFYDPFMYFFEQEESAPGSYPEGLFFNVFLRYWINSLISLAILYVVFNNRSVVKFAGFLYLALFLLLFPVFVYLMHRVSIEDYLAAFYVRRFLIHPVFILILLPAFYYQQLAVKGAN